MSTITTINASDQITNSRAVINTNFSNLNSDKIETSYLDTDTTLAANSDAKIPTQKAVKAYVDAGGNVNASTTNRGIVEEATQAEADAGTATGGTGARLFINPSVAASANTKGLVYKKKLEVDTTEITVSSNSSEATLFDYTVPANTLGTNNAIRFKMYLSALDLDTAGEVVFRFKYGGTTIGSIDINFSTSPLPANVRGVVEGIIVADGATDAQKGFLSFHASAPGGEIGSQANVGYTNGAGYGNGTATVDSTSSQTMLVSVDFSTAVASNNVTAEFWVVELIA